MDIPPFSAYLSADLFGERVDLINGEGITSPAGLAEAKRHRACERDAVADPSRRDRGAGAGELCCDIIGQPRAGRDPVQDDERASSFVARHIERRAGRPQIERRGLNRDQHQPRGAHGDLGLGFGMRRTVDHDEIGAARLILDPLCGTPSGQCCKLEAYSLGTEPHPPQIDPRGEAALRIDVEESDPQTLSQPCDGELGCERRLAGAALALRDRDYQPRHRPALAEVDGRAYERVERAANRSITSPRLRGEVGSRAQHGCGWRARFSRTGPSPQPSPRKAGRGSIARGYSAAAWSVEVK